MAATAPATERAQRLLDQCVQMLERGELPDDALRVVRRAQHVAETVHRTATAADEDLVGAPMVDAVVGPLESASAQFDGYITDSDLNRFELLNGHLDSVVGALSGWPPIPASDELAALGKELRELTEGVARMRGEFQTQLAELRQTFDSERAELNDQRDQRVGEQAGRLDQFEAQLDERLGALTERIDNQLPRLDEAIARFEGQFSTAEGQRRASYEEQVQRQATQAEELRTSVSAELEALGGSLRSDSEQIIGDLRALQQRAVDIVGVVGRTGMTGGYQQRASEEHDQAERWRWYTVIAGALAVLALVWAAVQHKNGGDVDEGLVIAKVALSGALGGLSGYAARQAHRHRLKSDAARDTELALASFPAYVEALDEATREELLAAFAFKFFGAQEDTDDGEPGTSALQQVIDGIRSRRRESGTSEES